MWKNYGDINFIEEGGVILENSRGNEGIYRIISCFQYDDPNPETGEYDFLFTDCEVNINEDWIDQCSVETIYDIKKEENYERYAVAICEHYDSQCFGNSYPETMSRRLVELALKECNADFKEAGVRVELTEASEDINFTFINTKYSLHGTKLSLYISKYNSWITVGYAGSLKECIPLLEYSYPFDIKIEDLIIDR